MIATLAQEEKKKVNDIKRERKRGGQSDPAHGAQPIKNKTR